jgi:hypothetical protein
VQIAGHAALRRERQRDLVLTHALTHTRRRGATWQRAVLALPATDSTRAAEGGTGAALRHSSVPFGAGTDARGDDVSPHVTSLATYFVTSDGKDLFAVLATT